MTKLMFALWQGAEPLADPLLSPALHRRLRGAGAGTIQVNVDDADVAGAMLRLQTFDEPVRAVVSVWLAEDAGSQAPREVAAVLGEVTTRLAGWEVSERRPLEPPVAPDGERADTLANVAFLRRPERLSHEAWRAHWHGRHTTVAIETQATFGYVQNEVVRAVTPDAPVVDALVEELFPSAAMSDLHAFYGSGGDDDELNRRLATLMESVAAFGADEGIDLVPTSRYVFSSPAL
ncbi:EthD domain-containing protein [Nocardioides pacificus]